MAQKDFNKEIGAYLESRRKEGHKDIFIIKKQAPKETVEDLHPNLESDKIHIINKEPNAWQRFIDSVIYKRTAIQENVEEPADEEGKCQLEVRSSRNVLRKLYEWLRREPEVVSFEEAMEDIETKEEELKEEEGKLMSDEEGVIEEERDLSKVKSWLIWDFIARFRPKNKVPALEEEIFMLEDDLKAISKITASVMRQLPPEKLHVYKQSKDFMEFKEILNKRNLIKGKKE